MPAMLRCALRGSLAWLFLFQSGRGMRQKVQDMSNSPSCKHGFALESHSRGNPKHGDVCRKSDQSGNWEPPRGCVKRTQPPFSLQPGTESPCRIAPELSGRVCSAGFDLETHAYCPNGGDPKHGDVCRNSDRSGNWIVPHGCRKRFKAPFAVHHDGNPCRISSNSSHKVCPPGFPLETHHGCQGDPQHGDLCRKLDLSGNWEPPAGCRKIETPPFTLQPRTSKPCRVSSWLFS